MVEKSLLLDRIGAEGEERLLLAKVLDRAGQAQHRNIPTATDFLSPAQLVRARSLLRLSSISENDWLATGGWDGAERRICLFLPDWLDGESLDESVVPLRYLRASFRPEDNLTHRDLLGSLMGLGIVRERIGDILVRPNGADLIVLDTVAEFLLQNWRSAGRGKLSVEAIAQEELRIPEIRCREIRDTVSSLRLDAVCAAGGHMARGKIAAAIADGSVQLNWQVCLKPDKLLKAGDVVSIRGVGKFQLAEIGGITKKGRTSIVIKLYA